MAALWAKTEKEITNVDQTLKRSLEGKMDIGSLTSKLNEEM